MNNVRKPIRIPQDLRDTVTALHINTTEMMQCYINSFRFYPYFSTRSEQEKSCILSRIRHGLTEFQRSGNIYVDPILAEINHRYGKLLIKLSKDRRLAPKAHDDQSRLLIEDWEKEVRPLINYPEEILLEGGGKLRLSFDFMLINIHFGRKIRRYMQIHMQRISMCYVYAHAYPGNPYNNEMVMKFFECLWGDKLDVFVPRTDAQTAVIEKYGKKFEELFKDLKPVKNYKKRLKVFRPLIKEWAGKMEEIKIKAQEAGCRNQ